MNNPQRNNRLVLVGLMLLSTVVVLGLGISMQMVAAQSEQPQYLPYNPTAAAAYADKYTRIEPYNNSDGCYILSNLDCTIVTSRDDEALPGNPSIPRTADGAHFLACALRAGGALTISGQSLCPPPPPGSPPPTTLPGRDPANFRMTALYSALEPYLSELPRVSGLTNLLPGDLLIYTESDSGQPCWGAMLITMDGSGLLGYAIHSFSGQQELTELALENDHCGEAADATFYRINADLQVPVVVLPTPELRDYTGAPQQVTWDASYDPTPGSGIVRYEVTIDGTPVARTVPNVELNVGMCSSSEIRVTAIDGMDNASTPESARLRVLQRGDLNRDGLVSDDDLRALDPFMGTTVSGADARYDLTGDGQVTAEDRLWLNEHLGEVCEVHAP